MVNIAVVLGNPSADICTRVAKLRDDLNLVPYESLGELFRESEYSQYAINRVVVSSSVLAMGDVDSNISRLRDLIRGQSEFSNVVFLCKEETDLDLEETLSSYFNQSECAVLSITSSSISSIIEYLSKGIQDLRVKYGFVSKIETDTNTLLDDSVEVPQQEEPIEEELTQVEKKHSGFLESLFGKSKKKETESEDENIENEEDEADKSKEDEIEEPLEGMSEVEDEKDETEEEYESTEEGVDSEEEEEYRECEHEPELSENSEDIPSPNDSNDVSKQISEDIVESDESVRSVLEDVKASPDLVEVKEDDNLINFGAEETYREKTTRIVERVVEVEKIVTVGNGKRSVFDTSSKKLVVITGDRRSGVTTLAYNMAVEFAKHVRVLYVDCDMIRHGILAFLDYSEFKKQDKLTKSAVTLCKTWEDIKRGVFRVSSTLDVLTADYGSVADGGVVETVLDLVADYYTDYDCVIVDLPMQYVRNAYSILSMASPIVTMHGSLNGVLGFISEMEIGAGCNVISRYMNVLCKKGTMILTGVDRNFKAANLRNQVTSIIDSDYPWMQMKCMVNPVLDENSLSYMLEV